MARSIRKGPYVDAKLDKKVMAMSAGTTKKGCYQDMEPSLYYHSGFCRYYLCCS